MFSKLFASRRFAQIALVFLLLGAPLFAASDRGEGPLDPAQPTGISRRKLAKAAPPARSTPQKGLGGFDFVLPNGDLIRNTEHPYNAV